jgi:hypothetical protein
VFLARDVTDVKDVLLVMVVPQVVRGLVTVDAQDLQLSRHLML